MWSTILPELMSITVFILTILCLKAGTSPDYLPDYAILSLNTTGLKESYRNSTHAGLPIHDVYNFYMMTTCSGYYLNNSIPPLAGVTCPPPSSYCTSPFPFPFPFPINPLLTYLSQVSPGYFDNRRPHPPPQQRNPLLHLLPTHHPKQLRRAL